LARHLRLAFSVLYPGNLDWNTSGLKAIGIQSPTAGDINGTTGTGRGRRLTARSGFLRAMTASDFMTVIGREVIGECRMTITRIIPGIAIIAIRL
jgi:hypothetical protein